MLSPTPHTRGRGITSLSASAYPKNFFAYLAHPNFWFCVLGVYPKENKVCTRCVFACVTEFRAKIPSVCHCLSLSLPLSFPACPMSQTSVCPSRGNDGDVFSSFSQSVSLSVCCAVRVHQVHIRCVSPDTLDAREEEASTLMRFGLVDAYACAHSGRATDLDPHGWTWGFPSSKAKAHTNTPQ